MDVTLPSYGDVDAVHWLGEATRVHQARLERHPRLAALLGPDVTPGDHLGVLARSLGFCAPLELALTRATGAPGGPTRAPLILRDLRALGLPAAAVGGLPVCAALPSLDTRAHVLGVRYVLDAVPFDGPITLRHLARTIGVTPARGGAFYAGGAASPTAKATLAADVRRFVARTGHPEALRDAAVEAYDALHAWLDA